jgi:hypothetical protein
LVFAFALEGAKEGKDLAAPSRHADMDLDAFSFVVRLPDIREFCQFSVSSPRFLKYSTKSSLLEDLGDIFPGRLLLTLDMALLLFTTSEY